MPKIEKTTAVNRSTTFTKFGQSEQSYWNVCLLIKQYKMSKLYELQTGKNKVRQDLRFWSIFGQDVAKIVKTLQYFVAPCSYLCQ